MILELLGMLVDGEALTGSNTYVGYCLDLVATTHRIPGASDIWIALSTKVAADYTTGDETYQFKLQTGTGVDGSDDINAGAITWIETPAISGNDARVDAVGDWILRCTLPMEIGGKDTAQRYLQLYYAQTGTTPTITIDFSVSPSKPRTDFNIQVESSPVGVP